MRQIPVDSKLSWLRFASYDIVGNLDEACPFSETSRCRDETLKNSVSRHYRSGGQTQLETDRYHVFKSNIFKKKFSRIFGQLPIF